MTVAINGIQTDANYPSANTGGCQIPPVALGFQTDLVVGNAAAVIRLSTPDAYLGPLGGSSLTDEFVIVAGVGQIVQASYRGANGFQARDFVSGTHATVYAIVWEKGDPIPQGGTSYAGNLSATGASSVSVSLPRARIIRNALGNQAMPSGAVTPIVFDGTSVIDTNGFFSPLAPDRLTIPPNLAGDYLVIGKTNWAVSAAGTLRQTRVVLSGGVNEDLVNDVPNAAQNLHRTVQAMFTMAVGDYVQLEVFQDTGGALNQIPVQSLDDISLELLKVG